MQVARANRGFSLLETLVAFSVATLALGVIFQIYAKGTTAVTRAKDFAHAVTIAQSRIAGIAVVNDNEYSFSGVSEDKYAWSAKVDEYADDSTAEVDSPLHLQWVEVEVQWHDGGATRSFKLRTLKPVRNEPGVK